MNGVVVPLKTSVEGGLRHISVPGEALMVKEDIMRLTFSLEKYESYFAPFLRRSLEDT
jgi:hypothetical protein